MNGPAGNGTMLIHCADDGRTYGLDFSGNVPMAAGTATSGDVYFGPRAQLVPGNVGGWLAALERFGTMDRATVFAPAVRLADGGQPVSPTLSYYMRRMLSQLQGADSGVASMFAPGGRPMEPGEVLRLPDLADTYRSIVKGGADVFYRGEIAEQIAHCVSSRGGWLSADDLRDFAPAWEEPLAIEHSGWRVMTPPPPCSGVQILETLRLLEAFDISQWDALSPEYLHVLIEAIKLARYDRVFNFSSRQGTDGAHQFLRDGHIDRLRGSINLAEAAESEGDWFVPPHTTHFSVADRAGNVVSSTQSLGAIFGSGVVVGGTGLILNGLLFLFELDPSAPNGIAPGKKMDDPMSPMMATHPDGRVLAVGSPGGQGILQTNVQMFNDVVHFGMSPQAAVESPRVTSWGRRAFIDKFGHLYDPRSLAIEDRLPRRTQAELVQRGHVLEPLGGWSHAVGAGAIVLRHANGILEGGADPRRDGLAYAF
jgi:gamma-glutamyltranspeptidase/glutathione hydrolase